MFYQVALLSVIEFQADAIGN